MNPTMELNRLLLVGLLLTCQVSFGQLIISGDTCSNTPLYDYRFENYQYGNHGYGFNILRNESIVYDEYVYYSYVEVYHMHFISDSIGFIYKSDDQIFRTERFGTVWSGWGSFPPEVNYTNHTFDGMYFIDENTGYYGTYYLFDNNLIIYKLKPGWNSFQELFRMEYDSTSHYYSISDNIDNPYYYCGDLNQLIFEWHILDDTIKVDLSLILDPTIGIGESPVAGITIGPNPTSGLIHISMVAKEHDIDIKIYDILGKEVSSHKYPDACDVDVEIPGKSGMYLIRVSIQADRWEVFKVLKS
jgi:hypothetical protein